MLTDMTSLLQASAEPLALKTTLIESFISSFMDDMKLPKKPVPHIFVIARNRATMGGEIYVGRIWFISRAIVFLSWESEANQNNFNPMLSGFLIPQKKNQNKLRFNTYEVAIINKKSVDRGASVIFCERNENPVDIYGQFMQWKLKNNTEGFYLFSKERWIEMHTTLHSWFI